MLELRGRPVQVVIRDGELGRRDTPHWYYLQEVRYYQELLVCLRLEAVRSRSSYEMASLVERTPCNHVCVCYVNADVCVLNDTHLNCQDRRAM